MLRLAGPALCCRSRLTSNVRPHNTHSAGCLRSKHISSPMKPSIFSCLRICASLALIAGGPSLAASISYKTTGSGTGYTNISISGEITSGDADKLRTLASNPGVRWFNITLDSPGGSLSEAIRLAKVVKAVYSDVSVASGGRCASACFLVWLAGSGRYALGAEYLDPSEYSQLEKLLRSIGSPPPKGFVGLHRPYFATIDRLDNNQAALTRALTAYLEEELVPRRLIDKMMSKPSNDIYWITDADIAELGEYPAAHEELLIQKCGYDRNSFKKALSASRQGRHKHGEQILDDSNRASECLVRIFAEAKRANIAKLRSGWIPD